MPLVLGVAGVLAVALAVVAWLVVTSMESGAEHTGGSVPYHSTPRSEWRAGETPFLYQTDPQWASHPYTVERCVKNGCGPTCLSMVYVTLTGRDDLDPAAMADFSERDGYVSNGMTAWALMTDGAAKLGTRLRGTACQRERCSRGASRREARHLQRGARGLYHHGPLHRADGP